MSYDDLSLDEDEVIANLRDLIPQGFAGHDILAELAPNGWAQCGLVHAFHPTAEQIRAEEQAFDEASAVVPFPDLYKIGGDLPDATEIDSEGECRDLVGRILWEILADDHSVIANDGRRMDLGGYDEASSVLDLLDKGEIEYEPDMEDWLDMWDRGDSSRFSCDLAFIEGRADFRPVYELIFRRLQALDLDWIYQFPKLRLYGFEQVKSVEGASEYSPAEAFADEMKQKAAKEALERKKAKLDAINQEAAEEAAKQTPPPIVQAYMNVFGRRPSGWPPA